VSRLKVYLVFSFSGRLAAYQVYLFKFFTILSYANSAINPFLYAFTNDAFKSAFADAFSCVVSERSRDLGGGEARIDAGAGPKRAGSKRDVQVQPAISNYFGCEDYGNAIQLETMVTIRQSQERQLNTDNNDVDSQNMRVIVHLEHDQQQQHEPHQNDQYFL